MNFVVVVCMYIMLVRLKGTRRLVCTLVKGKVFSRGLLIRRLFASSAALPFPVSKPFMSHQPQAKIVKIQDLLSSLLDGPVEALKAGEAVGMPTETVYGLAANCLSSSASEKIFKIKNRPMDNPLICHISSLEMLKMLVHPEWKMDETFKRVVDEFWPGPLTLLLPVHPNLPYCVTAGLKTVGVRFPSHPVALELITRAGFPLAAPSANLSGRPSPTTAAHVFTDLHDRINWIVDGGSSGVGLESTVVDLLIKRKALDCELAHCEYSGDTIVHIAIQQKNMELLGAVDN